MDAIDQLRLLMKGDQGKKFPKPPADKDADGIPDNGPEENQGEPDEQSQLMADKYNGVKDSDASEDDPDEAQQAGGEEEPQFGDAEDEDSDEEDLSDDDDQDSDEDGVPDDDDEDADDDGMSDDAEVGAIAGGQEAPDAGGANSDVAGLVQQLAAAEKDFYASKGQFGAGHHKAEGAMDTFHKLVRKLVRTIADTNGIEANGQPKGGAPGEESGGKPNPFDPKPGEDNGKKPNPFAAKDDAKGGKPNPFAAKGGKKPNPFAKDSGGDEESDDDSEDKKPSPFDKKTMKALSALGPAAKEALCKSFGLESWPNPQIQAFEDSTPDAQVSAENYVGDPMGGKFIDWGKMVSAKADGDIDDPKPQPAGPQMPDPIPMPAWPTEANPMKGKAGEMPQPTPLPTGPDTAKPMRRSMDAIEQLGQLVKARGHKYTSRRKVGSTWIYTYPHKFDPKKPSFEVHVEEMKDKDSPYGSHIANVRFNSGATLPGQSGKGHKEAAEKTAALLYRSMPGSTSTVPGKHIMESTDLILTDPAKALRIQEKYERTHKMSGLPAADKRELARLDAIHAAKKSMDPIDMLKGFSAAKFKQSVQAYLGQGAEPFKKKRKKKKLVGKGDNNLSTITAVTGRTASGDPVQSTRGLGGGGQGAGQSSTSSGSSTNRAALAEAHAGSTTTHRGLATKDIYAKKKAKKSLTDADGRALRKSWYEFARPDAKAAALPEEYLYDYLCAAIEEAYEMESRESAHRNTDAKDLPLYFGQVVMHEIVSALPNNKNLARACKKFRVTKFTVAALLQEKGLIKVKSDTMAEGSGDGNSAMGGNGLAGEVMAYSQKSPWIQEDAFAAKGRVMTDHTPENIAKSIRDDRIDPAEAYAHARRKQFNDLWKGTDETVRVNYDASCPIHGRDISKAQSLSNPMTPCTCN